jgi:hypothetical protein
MYPERIVAVCEMPPMCPSACMVSNVKIAVSSPGSIGLRVQVASGQIIIYLLDAIAKSLPCMPFDENQLQNG